jgi:hypothetical protein
MDDIDVILPRADHPIALAALTLAGWRPVDQRVGVHYDTYLVNPQVPGLPLELHWDVASWRERPTRSHGDDLWRQRVPITCFGTQAFGLPVEEELIALASHAGKPFHQFSRLIWSVDIAVAIGERAGAIDWEKMNDRAHRLGCRTVLGVALSHARRLGAAVPDGAVRLSTGSVRQTALAPLLDERWPLTEHDARLTHWLRYALWDSRRRQVMLLIGEVMSREGREMPRAVAHLLGKAAQRWWQFRRTRPPSQLDQAGEVTVPSRKDGVAGQLDPGVGTKLLARPHPDDDRAVDPSPGEE